MVTGTARQRRETSAVRLLRPQSRGQRVSVRPLAQMGAAALAITLASGASASPLVFTFDDEVSANPQHLSFALDSNPTPYASNSNISYIYPITANYQGINYSGSEVLFYTPAYGGGFQISLPTGYISASGSQLFSGSTASPMFSPGVYNLIGGLGTGNGTLTIAEAGAPGAPGPMIGLGWCSALAALGALGATRLRRGAAA